MLFSVTISPISQLFLVIFMLCENKCKCLQLSTNKSETIRLLAMLNYVTVPLGKVMVSESESDSDILFESRKPNKLTNGDARNGVKNNRPMTGFKMERRVKT